MKSEVNHIISDRESICICDTYACLCAFAWMWICMLVSCVQKLFQVSLWILAPQFNSMMLASSIWGENVGTSKLKAKNW